MVKVRKYAEADTARTFGGTESSKNTTDLSQPVVLFKNPGYDINALMSDYRFKLSTALAAAGLTGGDYARQVLRAVPTTVAPHMKATAQS